MNIENSQKLGAYVAADKIRFEADDAGDPEDFPDLYGVICMRKITTQVLKRKAKKNFIRYGLGNMELANEVIETRNIEARIIDKDGVVHYTYYFDKNDFDKHVSKAKDSANIKYLFPKYN